MSGKDLLGTDLTQAESKLLEAYDVLTSLLNEDLSPTAEANVKEAIASLWQALNNLALTDDRPDI